MAGQLEPDMFTDVGFKGYTEDLKVEEVIFSLCLLIKHHAMKACGE
jgi:hypothetical protein